MDEFRAHMQAQIEILREINANIIGLREDIKKGQESGVKHSMEQVMSTLKGTPFEGIIANMMAKAGG